MPLIVWRPVSSGRRPAFPDHSEVEHVQQRDNNGSIERVQEYAHKCGGVAALFV